MARPRKPVDTSTYAGRFAVQIKAIREKQKLSIEELSEKSGIPVTTLYNWEQGVRPTSIESLPLLAEVFQTTVPKLMPNN